ncbi:MAG: carbamoyltransferase C-terminal domain-containing protein [Sphingomonas sp.]
MIQQSISRPGHRQNGHARRAALRDFTPAPKSRHYSEWKIMVDKALILGLNRTSDASFCLLHGHEIFFGRKERLSREKHAWGSLGDIALYRSSHELFRQPIDVIVECYSSDSERSKREEYWAEMKSCLWLAENLVHVEISHHFAHAYSAFSPSGFDEAATLIVDNRGSPRGLVLESAEVSDGPGEGPLEVISVFDADEGGIRPVAKQWWDPDSATPVGLGMFYARASAAVLGRGNREGVLMGLAAHGSPTRFRLPPLEVQGCSVAIPDEWLRLTEDPLRFRYFRDGQDFSEAADFAASVQLAFEEALIAVARYARAATGKRDLVYAGGCALNCSANARLVQEAGFERIFIPPACDDGGTSIGCALYGAEHIRQARSNWIWDVDYLGMPQRENADQMAAIAAELDLTIDGKADLVGDVAQSLAEGRVVALFQGRSEAGPRALGNRSILARPLNAEARDFINSQVKRREWFRPLAPVVRLQSAPTYFEMQGPSPFMQQRAMVKPEWRERLEAVCHVDGSARVQTVTRAQNAYVYDLLGRVEDLTGSDVLLNTSFNGPDEPIVESFRDACLAFKRMPIDMLVAPPFCLRKP